MYNIENTDRKLMIISINHWTVGVRVGKPSVSGSDEESL